MVQPVLDKHIESTSDICSGRSRIAGTRIRVQDIAALHEFQGMTADEIVSGYPHITLADVYAALAYYHDHREQINRDFAADEELVARLQRDSHDSGNGKGANQISS